MANRHGRRARQSSRRPTELNESGTPTPDPAPIADVLPFPTRGQPRPETSGDASLDRARRDVQAAREAGDPDRAFQTMLEWFSGPPLPAVNVLADRRSLEAMGFVFPAPGEAFGELGGLGPPPDPLEERIRRELGL